MDENRNIPEPRITEAHGDENTPLIPSNERQPLDSLRYRLVYRKVLTGILVAIIVVPVLTVISGSLVSFITYSILLSIFTS